MEGSSKGLVFHQGHMHNVPQAFCENDPYLHQDLVDNINSPNADEKLCTQPQHFPNNDLIYKVFLYLMFGP